MNTASEDVRGFAVKAAFLPECRRVAIDNLVPLKTVRLASKQSHKYQQIVASVRAVGLVEPPAITPIPGDAARYFLLDGHLRIEALKDLGASHVDCLIAPNDDTYTYNKRINRLSAIQDHRMIVRAMERGVSPERLGAALGLSSSTIKQHFRMLDGITDEVAERLADKSCSAKALRILAQMKPIRQIEAADLMVGQRNYSVAFANAMLAATPAALLVQSKRSQAGEKVSADSMARMEKEIAELQSRNRTAEETYGPDVLHLTVIKGYIVSLLGKAALVRWLEMNRPEYLREFRNIAEIASLPEGRAIKAARQ
jgi:ParB-like chromosome segregation protein Spo0J